MAAPHFDLVLAGGGLANGLIALRLAAARPDLRIAIIDAGSTFGGNHTWSFFDADLTPAQHAFVAPLVAHAWPHYDVRFPTHRRRLDMGYRSATSDRLHAALEAALPDARRLTGTPIVALDPTRVTMADQRIITANAVIDGRGQRAAPALDLGWQKFVGLEVELAAPHGLTGPIIMDATVDQLDGYRFVYTLPFSPTTLLIEDTYYTDGPELPAAAVEARVQAYAAAQGWAIARIIRRESGVLPIAINGDIAANLGAIPAGIAPAGMAAARFNAITGYSLPHAVRAADTIAALPELSGATIDRALRDAATAVWESQGFYRMLNKMLFRAAIGPERRAILDRFYTLDAGLIGRFYAGQSTVFDKLRVLIGKPPIPIPRALGAILRN
jgi:lycopene beta-cyclase